MTTQKYKEEAETASELHMLYEDLDYSYQRKDLAGIKRVKKRIIELTPIYLK